MKKSIVRNLMAVVFLALFIILSITSVQAKLTVDIVVKPSFQVGEKAYFDYVINSDEDIETTYYSAVICPDYLLPFLVEKKALLRANDPLYGKDDSGLIFEEPIEPQTCSAIVRIISPETEAQEFSEDFEIIAKPSFDVRILTCKDYECEQPSRVFVKGQPIYIQVITEKDNTTIDAFVEASYETPSFRIVPLALSNKRTSFSLDEIGTHEIEVTSSKTEYKTIIKKVQIGIIETEPKIDSVVESVKIEETERKIETKTIFDRIKEVLRITGTAILDIFRG